MDSSQKMSGELKSRYPILSNSYIFKVELKTDLLVVLDLPYPKALS